MTATISPVYNLNINDTSKSLLNMMQTSSNAINDYYQYTISNLPSTNPFAGVISNPRTCDIDTAITGLNQLQYQYLNRYNNVQTLQPTYYYLDTSVTPSTIYSTVLTPQYILTGDTANAISIDPSTYDANPYLYPGAILGADIQYVWNASSPGIVANLSSASISILNFQTHTNMLITNLPLVIGMIQSSIGISNALGNTSNPNNTVNGFIGSILTLGAQVMNAINNAVSVSANSMNEGLAVIQQNIAMLVSSVSQLSAIINQENTNLSQALLTSTQLSLTQLLQQLPNDPYLNVVLSSVVSQSASNLINKG